MTGSGRRLAAAISVVMLLVAAISYFVNKSHVRSRKILDFLGFAPIALPVGAIDGVDEHANLRFGGGGCAHAFFYCPPG